MSKEKLSKSNNPKMSSNVGNPNQDIGMLPIDGQPPIVVYPSFSIKITSPTNNATLDQPSQGVPVTVQGTINAVKIRPETIKVRVKIGNYDEEDATLSADKKSWTFQKLFDGKGQLGNIVIYARGIAIGIPTAGENFDFDLNFPINVNIRDLIPPALSILEPNRPTIDFDESNPVFQVKLHFHDTLGVSRLDVKALFNGLMYKQLNESDFGHEGSIWTATIGVDLKNMGEYSISAIGWDRAGNQSVPQAIKFTTIDDEPPTIDIYTPIEGDRISSSQSGTVLIAKGRLLDRKSGVNRIEYSLDGSEFSLGQLGSVIDGWVNWQAKNIISHPGYHIIKFRFVDNVGNSDSRAISFEVMSSLKVADMNEIFSARSYLNDLINYATNTQYGRIINKQSGKVITIQEMESVFYQPFSKLVQPINKWSNYPVNPVRICIELLQKYMLESTAYTNALLVAHWKLDEASGNIASDISGFNNNGVLTSSGPSWRTTEGKIGGCLYFDGVRNNVRITNTSILEVGKSNSDFSLTFWIFLTKGFDGIKFQNIIGKDINTTTATGAVAVNSAFHMWLGKDNNRIRYRISTTATISEFKDSNSQVELNTWTHIAYIKSGNKLQLFINGLLDSELQLKGQTSSNSGPIVIGGTSGFEGLMDDVRIYKGALSPTSISILENTIELRNLVAHWKLDESAGGSVLDSSGNQHNGKLVTMPGSGLVAHWKLDEASGNIASDISGFNNNGVLTSSGPSWRTTEGKIGGCLYFDGVNNSIRVERSETLDSVGQNNSDFSVSFWIYLKEGPNGQVRSVMHKGNVDSQRILAFWLHPNTNQIFCRINTTNNMDLGSNSKSEIPLNTWTHIAYTKNGDKFDLFMNGIHDSTLPLNGAVIGNNGPLYLGKNIWHTGFKGMLDDIRVYIWKLTEADIRLQASLINEPLWNKQGKFGGSLGFNGNNAIEIDNTPILEVGQNNSDFSVSFWILLNEGPTPGKEFRVIMHKGDKRETERTFGIWLLPTDNRVHYVISLANNKTASSESITEIPLKEWTHIAYVKSANKLKLFINGELQPECTLTNPATHNSGKIYIGKDPWFYGFVGRLDDIRIFKGALSAAAISAIISDFNTDTVLKTTRSEYLNQTYGCILNRFGISYDELRLIQNTEEVEGRNVVAAKLGIDSKHVNKLFFKPGQITENQLEMIFGIRDTTRIISDIPKNSLLLDWKLEHLQLGWHMEDNAIDALNGKSELNIPIIEPDVVQRSNLVNPIQGNVIFDLWTSRSSQLDKIFVSLKSARQSKPNAVDGLREILKMTIAVPADRHQCKTAQTDSLEFLKCLYDVHRKGNEITQDLSKIYLDFKGFVYIIKIMTLASSSGVITESEWDDVYHILVKVKKNKLYDQWRSEERNLSIALTPDKFQLSAIINDISSWRFDNKFRREWQDKLQLRIENKSSIIQAFESNVQAVEAITLPLLRNKIVSALKRNPNDSEVDLRLSNDLLIDVGAGSSRMTSRIMQAIETLQNILFSIRTSRLGAEHVMNSWKIALTEEKFDAEMTWMGTMNSWQSAMMTFIYPEIMLLPTLRPWFNTNTLTNDYEESSSFHEWITEIREKPRLKPVDARILANDFINLMKKDGNVATKLAIKFELTDLNITPEELNNIRKECKRLYKMYERREISAYEMRYVKEIFLFVPLQLALQLQKSREYVAALDWFQRIYAYNLSNKEVLEEGEAINPRKIYYALQKEKNVAQDEIPRPNEWLQHLLNPHVFAISRPNPYTRYLLTCLIKCFLEYADSEFTRGTDESISRASALYLTARSIALVEDIRKPQGNIEFNTSELFSNPILGMLFERIENNLLKLRQGRTISGLKRQIQDSISVSPQLVNNLIANSENLTKGISSTPIIMQPTPYRFSMLIERSKQLANVAQQMESAFLLSLEKIDDENYSFNDAKKELEIAAENGNIQKLRITEAADQVVLAENQYDKIDIQKSTYEKWISQGPNKYEKEMIRNYEKTATLRGQMHGTDFAIQLAQLGMSIAASTGGNIFTAAAVGTFGAVAGVGMAAKTFQNLQMTGLEYQLQIATLNATFENRRQEWEFQKSLAYQDLIIYDQQIKISKDHKQIVEAEAKVSEIQLKQARATAEFISTKFSNTELYEWMSGILEDIYNYFLQQASATAQLAQYQLAFERQRKSFNFILPDYWNVPSEDNLPSNSSSQSNSADSDNTQVKKKDRRGLTGSARLLKDIYKLEQYALDTDKRKLNLVQAFSLSQLYSFEFQQFRESGLLQFSTPMKLFDLGFPGHYLRLIKRVRVSIIGMIPSVQGIRATLTSSGISRVVTDDGNGMGIFQQLEVYRDPEVIALTSPSNATGIFELDSQSEMRLPFEFMGVDTNWELKLPRSANPFNFDTISDVIFTIEYTALYNPDYELQVINAMDNTIVSDISLSFNEKFSDQWYDLLNFEQVEEPKQLKVPFRISREDFPPHLQDIKIQEVLLYLSIDKEKKNGIIAHISKGRSTSPDDASVTDEDGIISTRRGQWPKVKQQVLSPIGEWELSFRTADPMKNSEIRDWLKTGQLKDIILFFTFKGILPSWPKS